MGRPDRASDGCDGRHLRRVARRVGSGCGRPARANDRLSASYLIALAAGRPIGEWARWPGEKNKRLATLSIDTAIRFRSPAGHVPPLPVRCPKRLRRWWRAITTVDERIRGAITFDFALTTYCGDANRPRGIHHRMGEEARGAASIFFYGSGAAETAASERTKWAVWLRDLLEGQKVATLIVSKLLLDL